MAHAMVKAEAHKLIDKMPESSTWDDLISEIYVRQVIEKGLADSDKGQTSEVREVRARYGLPE